MNSKVKIIPKLTLITKLECLPCRGAKFIIQKLKTKYEFEVESICLNAANKLEIYEKYNLDNSKIPCVFLEDKLISYGKIEEYQLKDELEKYIKL